MELMIFDKILSDPVVSALREGDDTKALRHIIRFAETDAVTDNAVTEYMVHALADDDNILSYVLRSGRTPGEDLTRAALSDLSKLYPVMFETGLCYRPSENTHGYFDGYVESVKKLVLSKNADELFDLLCEHYRTLGSGILSKYVAFAYCDTLSGVICDESVTYDSLIGLEHQKKVLMGNTKAFVEGKAANNVLLFGDRGTGKSSCIKAILNMLSPEGLRMVEIPKKMISKIGELTEYLSRSPHKYILFLDDLSFESHDSDYRALKVAMEGQLSRHPDNVLIYATSNRRHLIKESRADRDGDDFHRNDNMQETLSLSERFGISLVFSAPNQAEYLEVVRGILKMHGIECTEELERRAIIWQMNYGGRNPRLAKQFVKSVLAERE